MFRTCFREQRRHRVVFCVRGLTEFTRRVFIYEKGCHRGSIVEELRNFAGDVMHTSPRATPPNSKHVFTHRFQEVFLVDVAGQVYDRRELSAELRDESSAYALHVIERETKATVFDRFLNPFDV